MAAAVRVAALADERQCAKWSPWLLRSFQGGRVRGANRRARASAFGPGTASLARLSRISGECCSRSDRPAAQRPS
jgi:hypothetical protein